MKTVTTTPATALSDGNVSRTFAVANIHCAICAATLETIVRGLPGVEGASADLRSATIWVRLDPRITSESDIVAALAGGGFEISRTV